MVDEEAVDAIYEALVEGDWLPRDLRTCSPGEFSLRIQNLIEAGALTVPAPFSE